MKLAIMQPYFLPYIGYFQLIEAVDLLIVYDNIKFTKRGWINRNRMLRDGGDAMFTLPVKNDSDQLNVCDRELAAEFNRRKLLNRFKEAYRSAPYFAQTFPTIEQIVGFEDTNLFRFLHHSIVKTCERLDITTEIRISSTIDIDHKLKSQDKVLAICEAVGADTYVNAIGGTELYSQEVFLKRGIELKFVHSKPFEYPQFGGRFVPWLSIVDVMMFNSREAMMDALVNRISLV